MRRTELINLMLNEAYQEIERQGFRFDTQADMQLRELIHSGVQRMSDRDLISRAEEARRNTRMFVRRLCDDQRRRDGRLILENRTFSMARMSICPLWPLC